MIWAQPGNRNLGTLRRQLGSSVGRSAAALAKAAAAASLLLQVQQVLRLWSWVRGI
jgi:hypothetical protein